MDYHAYDPRGLIAEAYNIDGISAPECRAIFFDWALSRPSDGNEVAEIETLLEVYGEGAGEHPMTTVLREGLAGAARPKGRRGGRSGRQRPQ